MGDPLGTTNVRETMRLSATLPLGVVRVENRFGK
jgi:hypothetical protein